MDFTNLDKNPLLNEDFIHFELKKLVILDRRKIKYFLPFINKKRKFGREIDESLDDLIVIIKKIKLEKLKDNERSKLLKNFKWVNQKIGKHNKKIKDNFFTNVIDTILKLFTNGKYQLKYQTLDYEIKTIENHFKEKQLGEMLLSDWVKNSFLDFNNHQLTSKLILFLQKFELSKKSICDLAKLWPCLPQTFKENIAIRSIPSFYELPIEIITELLLPNLSEEARIDHLLAANNHTLLYYYKERSFLKDNKLENFSLEQCESNISNKQKDILLKLIQLKDKNTIVEIQNTPLLIYLMT